MIEIKINRMMAVSGNGPVARFGFSLCSGGGAFMSINGCALWRKKDGGAGYDVSGPRGEEYNGKRPFYLWFDNDKFKQRVQEEAEKEFAKLDAKPASAAPQSQQYSKDDDLPF